MPRLDAARRVAAAPDRGRTAEHAAAPHACPFQPRCRFEVDLSRREVPQLVEIEPGTCVACFNPVPVDEWDRDPRGRDGMSDCETGQAPLVELEHLKVYFPIKSGLVLDRHVGDIRAVDDVSLTIKRGETVGLVGESGCGKSTVGRTILRLYEPTDGRILFDGQDISQLSENELRPLRRRMQMVFQDPFASLNPRHSVGRIVGEPLRTHGLSSRRGSAARVRELLKIVGLPSDAVGRYPHEFSGGQRQRIGLARALALNPDFIVADEPVSALDVSIQAQIINLFEQLQEEFELTYLFIAHDLAVVRHISDRIAVMYLGWIVEVSPAGELYENPLHPYTISLLSAVPIPDPVVERQRESILLAGDLPSPANPPAACRFHTRCPFVQPTRCRDEVPPLRKLRDRARGRVPLGRGDQGRAAHAARARAGLRARPARAGGRAAARLRISSASSGATRSSGGGRRRNVPIEQQLVEVLQLRAASCGREAGLDLERARERAHVRDASVRDEDPARVARLGRRDDHAAAQPAETVDALDRAHDVLERGDAVAETAGVFEAAAVGEVAQSRAQARQRARRVVELLDAQRARRESRAGTALQRAERRRLLTSRRRCRRARGDRRSGRAERCVRSPAGAARG